MDVIAIYGRAQCGKTPTLQLVYETLKKSGFTSSYYEGLSNGDFTTVMEKGAVIIGIASQGDYSNLLAKYLDYLEKAGCQRSACACRTRGGTKQTVRQYQHQLIRKDKQEGCIAQEAANQRDAEKIIRFLIPH